MHPLYNITKRKEKYNINWIKFYFRWHHLNVRPINNQHVSNYLPCSQWRSANFFIKIELIKWCMFSKKKKIIDVSISRWLQIKFPWNKIHISLSSCFSHIYCRIPKLSKHLKTTVDESSECDLIIADSSIRAHNHHHLILLK